MSQANGKPPPHNLEAEESLVGAALTSADATEAAIESGITSRHFYDLTRARYWGAISAVNQRGDVVDVVTVLNELRGSGLVHEGDGPELTGYMANTSHGTSPTAARSYSRIILECAELRQLAEAGTQMATEALAGNARAALDVAERALSDRIDAGPASGGLTPIDIGAVMLEGVPAVKADVLRRTDGVAVLVRGGVNGIAGEPGAGKTFLSVEATRQAMVAGETVAVLDYEGSERTWAERLGELGVSPAMATECLVYLRPGAISPAIVARALMRRGPSLVIVDSLAAVLAEHEKSENEALDVVWLLRTLCRPLAIAGAGVLVIDHVTKDKTSRGKWGRGSGAKLGEFDVGYSLELVESFARGHDGSAVLRIAKDRHGVIGPGGNDRRRSRIRGEYRWTVPSRAPTTSGGGDDAVGRTD
ncbi:MAG TPA: AAA family ATPase [Acidimicrobiales bacterium]